MILIIISIKSLEMKGNAYRDSLRSSDLFPFLFSFVGGNKIKDCMRVHVLSRKAVCWPETNVGMAS